MYVQLKTNNRKTEHPLALRPAEQTDPLCLRNREQAEGSIAFRMTSKTLDLFSF